MNRRKLLQSMLAIVAAGMAGQSAGAETVRQERSVAGFDRVVVHSVVDLVVKQGAHEQLFVTAEPRLMGNIVTRVERRTLIIETVGNFKTEKKLRVELTLRELHHLEADDNADIRVERLRSDSLNVELAGNADLTAPQLTLDALKLRVSGSASATLGGSTGRQSVQVGGSADYRGEGLDSAVAQVAASGSASASVKVRDSLDAEVSGSADVTYFGNPKVRKKVGGAASLERG